MHRAQTTPLTKHRKKFIGVGITSAVTIAPTHLPSKVKCTVKASEQLRNLEFGPASLQI